MTEEIEALRRELEAQRARAEDLARAQRLARVGSWHWEFETGEVRWSDEMHHLFGTTPSTFDGSIETVHTYFHPDDRERVRATIEATFRDGRPRPTMMRVLPADGEVRTVLGIGEMLRGPDGEPTGMMGVICDISERVRAERALTASEQQLRLALWAAGMATWEWRPEADALIVSDDARPLLDLAQGQPLTLGDYLAAVAHDDRERVERELRDALAAGVDAPVELEHRLASGVGERWVAVKGRVVGDNDELALAGTLLDVTERRKLEANLQQAQRLDSLGQLAGGVAHDFNNLLGVVLASADLLRRRVATQGAAPDFEPRLTAIVDAAERGATLTRQLLAFARAETGDPRPIQLDQALSRVAPMLRRLIPAHIEVSTALRCDGAIAIDPTQLEQLLINLALNARDAMPRGGALTLSTRTVTTPDGSLAELEVRDTGVGMDAATRERVFEPFFTTKRGATGVSGVGLGLAVVLGVVERSGGAIEVESAPDEGALFRVRWPQVRAGATSARRRAAGPTSARPGDGAILVVEDEPVLRRLVGEMLADAGYKTLLKGNGSEALAIAPRELAEVDLLLTDVVLPQIGGVLLARRMVEACPGIKVLFMSGYTDEQAVRGAPGEPTPPFIGKPFTEDALLRVVRRTLDSTPWR